jgi:hypothetical protein
VGALGGKVEELFALREEHRLKVFEDNMSIWT